MLDTLVRSKRERFWRHLLMEYDSRLRRYLFRAHVTDSDADDIIAEVWSRAVSRETSLRQADGVWPTLHLILRDVRGEYARIERREVPADPASLDRHELDPAPDDSVGVGDLWEWTMRRLSELPQRQREAVDFHYLYGWAFARIGRAMGTAESTARVHALHGLRRLRELATDEAPARRRAD